MSPAPALLASFSRNVRDFEMTCLPEKLTGGNLNYVWRLRSGEDTLILKQAPPFVASHPEFPLSPARLSFEARALRLFQAGGLFEALAPRAVRPPRLIFHDEENHFLVMEDVSKGGSTFSAAVADGSASIEAGRALGCFMAQLHLASANDSFLARAFDNRSVQEARMKIQYLAVEEIARSAGISSVARLGENARVLGRLLLEPGHCLVMGDLWPPSIFSLGPELRIIDWEFAHFGRPLQDLAHFGAHCWMQAHTSESKQSALGWFELWANFFAMYKETAAGALPKLLDPRDEQLMNVHAGAEILMRCVGPFVAGFRYDYGAPGHSRILEALTKAVGLLDDPPSSFFLDLREQSEMGVRE